MKIEKYQDKKKEWRWRLISKGRIIAESGEGYKRRGNMIKSLRSALITACTRVNPNDFI